MKLYVPATTGVPLIEPVFEFRTRPRGKLPLLTEKTYGAIPPVTELTAL